MTKDIKDVHINKLEGQIKDIAKEQKRASVVVQQVKDIKDVHINRLEGQIKDIAKDQEKADVKV